MKWPFSKEFCKPHEAVNFRYQLWKANFEQMKRKNGKKHVVVAIKLNNESGFLYRRVCSNPAQILFVLTSDIGFILDHKTQIMFEN